MTARQFINQSAFFMPKELGGNDNLSSPDLPGSYDQLDVVMLIMLENARKNAEIPFYITSGFRTIAHNAKVGGSERSSHTKGFAVDISCTTSAFRKIMIFALIKAGFQRIGIAKTFIHVDNDPSKNAAIWLY